MTFFAIVGMIYLMGVIMCAIALQVNASFRSAVESVFSRGADAGIVPHLDRRLLIGFCLGWPSTMYGYVLARFFP